MGFQMTVSTSHTLSLNGVKAALNYFDSVCQEFTTKEPAAAYRFYFATPPDLYDQFSDKIQNFVDKSGVVIVDNATAARVEQWILKVELCGSLVNQVVHDPRLLEP